MADPEHIGFMSPSEAVNLIARLGRSGIYNISVGNSTPEHVEEVSIWYTPDTPNGID